MKLDGTWSRERGSRNERADSARARVVWRGAAAWLRASRQWRASGAA
jgi:hypothetical protein